MAAIFIVATSTITLGCHSTGMPTFGIARSGTNVDRPVAQASLNRTSGLQPRTVTEGNRVLNQANDRDQREESPISTSETDPASYRLVGFQESDPPRPVPQDEDQGNQDPIEGTDPGPVVRPVELPQPAEPSNPLTLSELLKSVQDCFPEIEVAIGELETADGKVLASWGEFDSVFAAHSISQPLGFYQTYRNGTGITRPLYGGGEVYGTWRIGDGNFEPWFGERETNEAGEFKAGFSVPLLKDRNIDRRRAALLAAGADRSGVVANVESRLLFFERLATQAYWDWLAAGRAVTIQQRLLNLALDRVKNINERVLEEDLPKIAGFDNERFIRKRRNDLIKARRAMEKAAIKMSLFYRDANCQPQVVMKERLPLDFPDALQLAAEQLRADVETALSQRPELLDLNAQRQRASIDLQYARNLTLPKLDIKGFAGQDIGGETSSKGDKTPFELQLGVHAEVPIQRREGLGKIQAAEGKITQIDAKLQMTRDKIRAEIQDAASAVNAAFDQIRQSTENVDLTRRSLELGRAAFDLGNINLIELNIYETAVADAELQLLDAQFKYFFYRAVYQTAIRGTAFQ